MANETTSTIVTEQARPRVSVEIERMTKGPAKVSVRVDGDDSAAIAEEALQVYGALILSVDTLTPEEA